MSHNPRETYTVDFPGLRLEIEAEAYPGQGDPDILGESQFAFRAEDVRSLDEDGEPFLFVEESRVDVRETPLVEVLAGFQDEYPRPTGEDAEARLGAEEFETRNVDAAIVTLGALMESARIGWRDSAMAQRTRRTVRVRWHGDCSAFWLFHDLTHASEDVELQAGGGQVRVNGAHAEDRANLEGARRALKAGMPLGEILAELVGLRKAFRARFGEDSTALVDFLQDPGDGSGVDVDSMRREFRELVEDLAREVLDEDPDRTEDAATESAHEHVDGAASSWSFDRCARILVGAEDPRAGEDFADPDNGDAEAMLLSRAFGAILQAVEARVRELHAESRCVDCADRARVKGAERCARCAQDLAEARKGEHAEACPCHACALVQDERRKAEAETTAEDAPVAVLFRRWPKAQGGDVLALFPLLPETRAGQCVAYARIGQHGAADYAHVIGATRPADPEAEDVRALRAELERIGYRLDIRKRAPSWRKVQESRRAAGL